ncbi:ribose ABC transporter ATP-binding protein RbsA [Cardiobacteriaceae bacterium TAE3-ERU3]|nr:ribose ABC transporter ATP-binding protein RbsA [Cardiobacteriaceae bacterium TAE3-ERU3]
MMGNEPLLRMVEIDKNFPGVKALEQAGLNVYSGRIMALIGENGAGKSTLMKVLSGIYAPDGGHVTFNGQPAIFSGPRDAQQAGISIIHQELNLINALTVAENIFLGRFDTRFGSIDWSSMRQKANQLLNRLNVSFSADDTVADLSMGQRQMVEIAKALSFDAQIIIFDEPTDALTDQEAQTLFSVMRDLKAEGKGLVFISHRLKEIFHICDDVTVLRDGLLIGEYPISEITEAALIERMVGRSLSGQYPDPSPRQNDVLLSTKDLCGTGIEHANLTLHKSEILGISGLMGAGRTELAKLLYGAGEITSGQIYLNGQAIKPKSPGDALRLGIAYVSEDRKEDGLILGMSVADNMTLSALPKFSRYGHILEKETSAAVERFTQAFRIKTPNAAQLVGLLSGGNQQKVSISKALMTNPDVLILDEPTRGVDVGARKEIYDLISELKQAGMGIILISSDMPEILGMSDRIVTLCQGRITAEFDRSQATQEALLSASMPTNQSSHE